jgi:hypothetical protein
VNYRILSAAADDLSSAADFYESQMPGLGLDFLAEFEAAMSRILRFPNAWRQVSPRHRRCLFRRFPFAILYTQESGGVIVSGVMDLRMYPLRQKQRIAQT